MRFRASAIALLTLLGLVLGHVSAWAHDGAVRHVLCARHGELVDAPELARAVASGAWLVGVSGNSSDEHCAIANGIRQDAASIASHAVLPLALPAIEIDLAIVTPRLAAALDFRIAPKTSPPDLAS